MPDPSTYRPAPGSVPDEPGVYRFSDERGRVIYVGKARNLRARLSSYFQDLANLHARTQAMVTSAAISCCTGWNCSLKCWRKRTSSSRFFIASRPNPRASS